MLKTTEADALHEEARRKTDNYRTKRGKYSPGLVKAVPSLQPGVLQRVVLLSLDTRSNMLNIVCHVAIATPYIFTKVLLTGRHRSE